MSKNQDLVIAETLRGPGHRARALTPVAGKFDKHDEHFENDRYVVTSAVGHLVEIQAPGAIRRQARQVELCPPARDSAAL